MRRVRIDRPGGYHRLRIVDEPPPEPGPGEVSVDVRAAGVNYADCAVRMGLYASARDFVGWPVTPGFEVAGAAEGRRVFAVTRFSGYQESVCVPRAQVFDTPESLTDEQAAGFPTIFLTAYYALCELGRPRRADSVLVHSAAGGVGGALVQIGKLLGARVVGIVGSAHKVDAARAHGADAVIDRSREPWQDAARRHAPGGYSVVLDSTGPATLRASYRLLAPTGRLVSYGFGSMLARGRGTPSLPRLLAGWLRMPRFSPLKMTNDNKSVLAFNLSYLFDRLDLLDEAMGRLLEWLARGAIRPPPVQTYSLDRVADAHRDLESGNTTGKLVLTMYSVPPPPS